MNTEERINAAVEKRRLGDGEVIRGMEQADPVWQRRHLARAAARYREAAALLDDNGFLSPDWEL